MTRPANVEANEVLEVLTNLRFGVSGKRNRGASPSPLALVATFVDGVPAVARISLRLPEGPRPPELAPIAGIATRTSLSQGFGSALQGPERPKVTVQASIFVAARSGPRVHLRAVRCGSNLATTVSVEVKVDGTRAVFVTRIRIAAGLQTL